MISRKHRFHGRGSLSHVYQAGKTIRTPELSLRYMTREHRKVFRLAVVVSKNVSRSAVVRNRIRRRIYDIIYKYSTAISQPYDLVVTVYKAEAGTMPSARLNTIVQEVFVRAGIIESPEKGGAKSHAIIDVKET